MKNINKKMALSTIMVVATMLTWVGSQYNFSSGIENSEFLRANVEALTDGDQPNTDGNNSKLDCSYTPVLQPCSMFVSADVAVRIFGKKVVSGDTVVEINLTGAQECEREGTKTCQPVRCIDLIKTYQGLF